MPGRNSCTQQSRPGRLHSAPGQQRQLPPRLPGKIRRAFHSDILKAFLIMRHGRKGMRQHLGKLQPLQGKQLLAGKPLARFELEQNREHISPLRTRQGRPDDFRGGTLHHIVNTTRGKTYWPSCFRIILCD